MRWGGWGSLACEYCLPVHKGEPQPEKAVTL